MSSTPTATTPHQPPPPPTPPATISHPPHQQATYNINRVCSPSGSLQRPRLLATPQLLHMGSITAMWTNWVEEDRAKTQRDEDLSDPCSLPLKFVERSCLPEMKKHSYCMPTRRALSSTLESGLEALPAETNCRGQATVTMCTLWHFLNLLWQPICTFIEDLLKGMAPTWSSELDMNHKALLLEMNGTVSAPDDSLAQEEWHICCTQLSLIWCPSVLTLN